MSNIIICVGVAEGEGQLDRLRVMDHTVVGVAQCVARSEVVVDAETSEATVLVHLTASIPVTIV